MEGLFNYISKVLIKYKSRNECILQTYINIRVKININTFFFIFLLLISFFKTY